MLDQMESCNYVIRCLANASATLLHYYYAQYYCILSLMVDVLVTTTLALLRLFEINLAGPRSFFQKIRLTFGEKASGNNLSFYHSVLTLNEFFVMKDTHCLGRTFLLGPNHLVALLGTLDFQIPSNEPFLLITYYEELLYLILSRILLVRCKRANLMISTLNWGF